MLSSYYQEDLFYMGYNVYSAEYKMAIVEEYVARDVTVRDFVKEKNIPIATFSSWITKFRKAGYPCARRDTMAKPMEITHQVKQIIKEEKESFFTLETKGMKFTFSINNLKQVLEAISND